ncbi:MAG: thioesterase family protein [Kiritimatiellae bacterium]|nr:thioesterase family protein [Kiritimatiellia bacterium]
MKKVTIQYRVPYADTDQMQVVYYGNYLTYFERSRNELLREMGFSYKELEAMGCALPVKEAHVNYLLPAAYDDLLEITGWCEFFQGVRMKIRCEVRRNGQLLAEGYTLHATCDIKTMRPARPPQALRDAIAGQ